MMSGFPSKTLTGYYEGDFNMDTQVDMDDKVVKWEPNAGKSTYPVKDTVVTPISWTCGDTIIDSRDGQSYNTVQIGEQCWMAENMNVGLEGTQTNNGIIEKSCYNNDPANCEIYGGLYSWYEMMQYNPEPGSQGICPDGWHIPQCSDWGILFNHLGDSAGGKMKETGTIHWASPNICATNVSGFTALPGGEK